MEEQLSELTTYANALWVLVSAALVFFMHAGFALVESGFCRRKNAVMVLMKNFGVVAISSLIFYLVGYGVMFGEGNAFMGLASFFPSRPITIRSIRSRQPPVICLKCSAPHCIASQSNSFASVTSG